MGNRSPSLTCIVCFVLALCRHSVTVESVKAEADKKANDSIPRDALSHSLPAPAHFFQRHRPDIEEEDGQLQPQSQEELRQRDVHSAVFTELVPPSVGACTSFVDNGQSADDDVSCFPHDKNIGCNTHTFMEMQTNTVRDCLKQCRAVNNCSHFTWNKYSKLCHLKNDVPSFYTYVGDMTGPRSCKSYCYESCLTYDMTPWKTLNFPDQPPQLCHSACWASSDNCSAWSFDNGVCKLFPKGFSAYRATGRNSMVTGSRKHCETNPEIRIEELNDGHSIGSCLKSDDIGSTTADLTPRSASTNSRECQGRCASDNRCTHYTYNSRTQMCSIKGGEVKYSRSSGDATGARDCIPG